MESKLSPLQQPSLGRFLFYLGCDSLILIACFIFLVAQPSAWICVLLFFVIARYQRSLAILMHDAAHFRVCENKFLNDFIGQFLISGPIFFNLYRYRKYHLLHHRYTQRDEDPDLNYGGIYPCSKLHFLSLIIQDLSGFTYWRESKREWSEYFYQIKAWIATSKDFPMTVISYYLSLIVSQTLILSILFYFEAWQLYIWFWLLPRVTWGRLTNRIRVVAEHSNLSASHDPLISTRTVTSTWGRFWLAPHGANYHREHHLYPSVPFYHLRKVHNWLNSQDNTQSYWQVLRQLVH